MSDQAFRNFAARQKAQTLVLTNHSDLVQVEIIEAPLAQRYLATFRCRGLVQEPDGRIAEADQFAVGIFLPEDYLRRADPAEVLTWLGPRNVFHPNINGLRRAICIGRLAPGTEVVSIIYQVYEMIVFRKYNTKDPLNPKACAWTRTHQIRFPIDPRPLRRPSDLAQAFAAKPEARP